MSVRQIPELARYYNPVASFKKSHPGRPNPIVVAFISDPWGLCLTLYFALLGLYTLIALASGGVIPVSSRLLGNNVGTFGLWNWTTAMLIGGPATVYGRTRSKYRLEQAGLGFLIYASSIYAAVAIYVSGASAIAAAGAYIAIGSAALIRLRVLRKNRKALTKAGEIVDEERRNGNTL